MAQIPKQNLIIIRLMCTECEALNTPKFDDVRRSLLVARFHV